MIHKLSEIVSYIYMSSDNFWFIRRKTNNEFSSVLEHSMNFSKGKSWINFMFDNMRSEHVIKKIIIILKFGNKILFELYIIFYFLFEIVWINFKSGSMYFESTLEKNPRCISISESYIQHALSCIKCKWFYYLNCSKRKHTQYYLVDKYKFNLSKSSSVSIQILSWFVSTILMRYQFSSILNCSRLSIFSRKVCSIFTYSKRNFLLYA